MAPMNVRIEVIPHEKQRYETVGDWYYENATLVIKVSCMKNWRYEMLVARHELDEALLCRHRTINEREVTDFDTKVIGMNYEGEPGDLPEAPYHKEHFFATSLERLLAHELEVDWHEYEAAIQVLGQNLKK